MWQGQRLVVLFVQATETAHAALPDDVVVGPSCSARSRSSCEAGHPRMIAARLTTHIARTYAHHHPDCSARVGAWRQRVPLVEADHLAAPVS